MYGVMNIIGHHRALADLTQILAQEAPAQAYLFTGPSHVGKYALAQQFAQALITDEQKLSEISQHTDLITVAPQRTKTAKGVFVTKDIGIEEIRHATASLAQSPLVGVRRVLIVCDADCMTVRAQNALLKTLEEPPHNSIIILVTAYDGRLLSTIHSRVRRVVFGIVSDQDLTDFVATHFTSKEDQAVVARVAMGRPGIVMQCVQDPDLLAQYRADVAQWEKLATMTIHDKIQYAAQLAEDTDHAKYVLRLYISLWRSMLRSALTNEQKEIAQHIEVATKTLQLLETTNANVRLALEDFLFHI
jgi:DNA polymerase-3 subunit delta'